MYIYLIVEDGESFCIKAHTMVDALKVCEQSYLEDRREDEGKEYHAEHETRYYRDEVLESCALIGELKN